MTVPEGSVVQQDAATAILPFSDDAVRARTGKVWSDWFALLDAAGAAALPHKEIATLLVREHDLPGWWAQSVTIGYERARGLRAVNQKCTGDFAAAASKTVAVPLDRLYEAWADETLRRQWLADSDFTIRKATPSRSKRITWLDGSSVEAMFYAKGDARSQVSIDHRKLPDPAAVERSKTYWKEQLDRLKTLLER